MKKRNFLYLEFTINILQLKLPYNTGRPSITAKLAKGNNPARFFELLIDTGADYSLISRSDAILLGINYNKIKADTIKVNMANLDQISARKTRVKITIGDHEFKIPILVAYEQVEPLLGRKGVFEHFEVIFKEAEQMVVFKKI